MKKKFVSPLFIALIAFAAFAIAPAGAAPKEPKFSHPLVAAVDTAKAGPVDKKATKKMKKAKKATAKKDKADKGELGATKK